MRNLSNCFLAVFIFFFVLPAPVLAADNNQERRISKPISGTGYARPQGYELPKVQYRKPQIITEKKPVAAPAIHDAPKPVVNAHAETLYDAVEKTSGGLVRFEPRYSKMALGLQSDVTGKPIEQLKMRRAGIIKDQTVYISGQVKGSFMAEKTNEEDKFAILSRLPGQHDGDTGSRFVINDASIAVTANITPYASAYAEIEYTETEYPGQNDIQMRKAYVTFGDLDESGLYASFGRNTIDFGDMDSYNPITHTMNTHYFWAVSDDPTLAVGYIDDRFDVTATAINGGRQLRVADAGDSGHVKNFAVNANVNHDIFDNLNVRFGAGYLHATSYNSSTPHHTADAESGPKSRNPAWDAVLELTSPEFDAMVEYTQTVHDWPATNHPVSALTAQAAYKFSGYDKQHKISAVYSRGEQGDSGTEYETMTQMVLGYALGLSDNVEISAEYVRNMGFAPLVAITTASDHSVRNDSVIVGAKVNF